MAETTNNTATGNGNAQAASTTLPANAATLPAPAPEPAATPGSEQTRVKGRFNQYQSGYWVLALPLLGARYFAEGLNEIWEPKRLKAKFEETLDKFFKYDPKSFSSASEALAKKKIEQKGFWKQLWKPGERWPLPVAAVMLAVTTAYTWRTYGDMKQHFKEALGWEFDKDPQKVNAIDILKSKNTLIRDARRNFEWRTFFRYLVQAPFAAFLFATPFKAGKYKELTGGHVAKFGAVLDDWAEVKIYDKLISPKGAVNLAVGASSAYLASDALLRKRTFFEELQTFIDNKFNHADRIGDAATAQDLMNLYDRQARGLSDVRPLPKMNSPEWQSDVQLFERIADLMNQTYGNKPNTEQANFTVPKLIYMLGMHLLKTEDPKRNMAYVELANRYGIKAAEQVAGVANGHGNLREALASYPDIATKIFGGEPALAVTAADNAMLKSMGIAPEPVAAEPKTFAADALRASRPVAAENHTQRMAQQPGTAATVGVS
jgi:hypothetical protein